MSKYIPGNQKHLTLEDRKYIEKSLNAGCSFKAVSYTHLDVYKRQDICITGNNSNRIRNALAFGCR